MRHLRHHWKGWRIPIPSVGGHWLYLPPTMEQAGGTGQTLAALT